MNKNPTRGNTFDELFAARLAELGDWRADVLATLRTLIKQADPDVVEEWGWNIPLWKHGGLICTGETYKAAVKTTFAKGASLPDPKKLFNASLDGGTRRAIDIQQGEKLDAKAFKDLFRAAVALSSTTPAKPSKAKHSGIKSTAKPAAKAKPTAKAKKK
jgi:hypothetical protein